MAAVRAAPMRCSAWASCFSSRALRVAAWLVAASPLERDETLVAAHIGALVDGHRQMTLAEQAA